MTLCPAFFDADIAQKIRILVHEASHIQPGLAVTDRAYGWERLINVLGRVDPAQALNNADSYTLLVLGDNGITGVSGTVAPSDDVSALPPADRRKAEAALAYLQRWNTRSRQQATALYARINRGISAGSWLYSRDLADLRFIARHFGTTVRSDRPRDRDRVVLAGIYDRFVTMGRALKKSLKVTVSSGNTRWEPGPGDKVEVAPSLWRRSVRGQVRMLLRRLATAAPDIRARLVSAYVELSDRFRQQRGEGP
jgi:hypothetical protein